MTRFFFFFFFFLFFFFCRFCTKRLQRLRKSLKFTYGKKKFTFHDLTPGLVKNERFLLLPLVNAERCWASHLDLAREQEQQKDTNGRIHFHALKRIKKASKWARQLAALCDVRADERTRLEATAYAAWMGGLLHREKLAWREATDSFFVAQTVFGKLAQVGDAEHRAVAQSRAENIEPLVAYCAYRLGGAADRSTMDKALLEKLDAYLAASAHEQAKQQTVSWEGHEIEIPTVASASVTRARFEILEANAAETSVADPMGLVRACGACEKLMGSLADVAAVCAKHAETNWGRQLAAWTRAEQTKASTRRNLLLVRLAAVRVALDGTGPAPADETAFSRGMPGEQDREAFVEASQEYVGKGKVTCVSVARILDSLAAQAMPQEDAKEEDRKTAAAVVLRFRGLRALYLARHQAFGKAWKEALALANHAVALLEESGELAPLPETKRDAQGARREVRIMKSLQEQERLQCLPRRCLLLLFLLLIRSVPRRLLESLLCLILLVRKRPSFPLLKDASRRKDSSHRFGKNNKKRKSIENKHAFF